MEREIFAEIRITFYKDGDTECAWPEDEMVARALLHKASAAFEDQYRKAQMIKAMKNAPSLVSADARTLKGLTGGKGRRA